MDPEMMQYFIKKTDERFDKIDAKLEELLSFKWKLAGVVSVISFVSGVGIQVLFKMKGL